MTKRAIASVPVDWQLQLTSAAPLRPIVQQVMRSTHPSALEIVYYANIQGLAAQTGPTLQTTGPGKAVGLDPSYQKKFSSQIRLLAGSANGVLLAQQTAATLHANVGQRVRIQRIGLPPADVTVNGIVDLRNADSFFQDVGAPAVTAPRAPPDNVLLLPVAQWHKLFAAQAQRRPDSTVTQLHIRIPHELPGDPGSAYFAVHSLANNLEARLAGSGIIADNLAVRLLSVRSDALYARVLFLFLGLPGAVLAALITIALAAAGEERRRVEQGILRMRGATTSDIVGLAVAEAFTVGLLGVISGFGLEALIALTLKSAGLVTLRVPTLVGSLAALAGILLALYAIVVPAWREAQATVVSTRAVIGTARVPLWQRMYLDVVLLVLSGLVFWQTAGTGYQIVVAPEGIPESSVSYQVFVAPLFLWLGSALLVLRLGQLWLRTGQKSLAAGLHTLAGKLSLIVAAAISRQRNRIMAGVVLAMLGFSFAISTAIFNTTFNAQSRVDAELTNGSDVTITGQPAAPAGALLDQLARMPGVAVAEPMQHRLAYVGNDLQDIYGIDPHTIRNATNISNAFFVSGNAAATLDQLAARPDGVLVAAETAKDFQLNPGDRLNLRLQFARDHRYHVLPFTFIGVVREFPTAPRDSFLVANLSYIGRVTGNPNAEVVLLRVKGDIKRVAAQARTIARALPGATVSDINSAQRTISSSLTAVDLRGLSWLELSFGVILLAAVTGLTLALGIAERRRTFIILWALGAKVSQLGAFFWSEAALIFSLGALFGCVLGFGLAAMLVKLLTGVFDPPPESLIVPGLYLAVLFMAAAVSTVVAVLSAQAALRHPSVAQLRDL